MPVFDEAARFADFAKPLAAYVDDLPAGSELLFVDDGSTDGTPSLIEAFIAEHDGDRVRLLRRPHRGKGAAVAAGLRSLDAEYLAFCDLDLSTPLDQFERVVRAAQRAAVVAIGSRDLAMSQLLRPEGRVREALGRSYNRLLQATLTPGVVDTQCGAKAAARDVWHRILPYCHETGYAWDAEVVAVAFALDIGVQEVAIAWRHDDRSKVRLLRDGAAMVSATRRIRGTVAVARHSGRAKVPSEALPGLSGVFDDSTADDQMEADRWHWWFRSKAALVATAIGRTAPSALRGGWLVDSGAGAGGVTSMLGWDVDRTVVIEGSDRLVQRAHARGLHAFRGAVDQLPVGTGSASVVCLLDVIEHLRNPVGALREAGRCLAPGGLLIVNVPAHTWLWSAADEQLGHHRRYTRRLLRAELDEAGFDPIVLTHVFSWLVAPVWLQRQVRRPGQAELGLDQTSVAVDRAAMVLTMIERFLVGRLSLPFGTSVLCAARRRS